MEFILHMLNVCYGFCVLNDILKKKATVTYVTALFILDYGIYPKCYNLACFLLDAETKNAECCVFVAGEKEGARETLCDAT